MRLQNIKHKAKSVGVAPLGDPLHTRNTQSGITLVAFIITVIVLLILARVNNFKTNVDISMLSAIAY